MPNYQSYPTSKTTRSRKQRKGQRRVIFLANKKMNARALKRAAALGK